MICDICAPFQVEIDLRNVQKTNASKKKHEIYEFHVSRPFTQHECSMNLFRQLPDLETHCFNEGRFYRNIWVGNWTNLLGN